MRAIIGASIRLFVVVALRPQVMQAQPNSGRRGVSVANEFEAVFKSSRHIAG